MQFISLSIQANPENSEILIAELAEVGFDYFEDTKIGFDAFCEEQNYNQALVDEIFERYAMLEICVANKALIEKKNWNEEWEKNFNPVIINEKCRIRATFHEYDPQYEFDILIEPKMSFGTGHHATTASVMRNMFGIDHNQKRVLDVGCGTAVLAILAEKLGATEILAFDIDEWSVENAEENFKLNQSKHIKVLQGNLKQVAPEGLYDIVLANINRNVLLSEIPAYSALLVENGVLIVSGFYTHDEADITACAIKSGLRKINEVSENDWMSVVYRK